MFECIATFYVLNTDFMVGKLRLKVANLFFDAIGKSLVTLINDPSTSK